MRVRISYGSDIDDVPKELEKLFFVVEDKSRIISRQIQQIQELLSEEDVETCLTLIEKLRLNLGEVDSRVSDISQIAAGYVTYKQNEGAENAGEGRSSMDPTGSYPVGEPSKQPTGDSNRPEA